MLIGLIQRETDNISFQQDAELPAFAAATYSIYCKCNNDGLSLFFSLSILRIMVAFNDYCYRRYQISKDISINLLNAQMINYPLNTIVKTMR